MKKLKELKDGDPFFYTVVTKEIISKFPNEKITINIEKCSESENGNIIMGPLGEMIFEEGDEDAEKTSIYLIQTDWEKGTLYIGTDYDNLLELIMTT